MFEQLKEAFTTVPVLIHFDPKKPSYIETDTSRVACRGVLLQPIKWPVKDRQKAKY